MKLNHSMYERMMSIRWFAYCGKDTTVHCGIPERFVQERPIALQSMFSARWANATTEAQGRLTGYLAKTDYFLYGSTWNQLAKESWSILEASIGPHIRQALEEGGWEDSMANIRWPECTPSVSAALGTRMVELLEARAWTECLLMKTFVNVNRACLEMTYRQHFRKAPIFFEHLLQVYESGHVPCGWEGNLDEWPGGRLLVH
jgi:hypothetical protein